MQIKESAENYLEAILAIKTKNGSVRSIDVANHLNVSKPSVSVAMKAFREEGYVLVDGDGEISLTDKGMEIAKKIFERHELIAGVLMYLGVSEETAFLDSCKIEHDLSNETYEKIKEFYLKHKKEQ